MCLGGAFREVTAQPKIAYASKGLMPKGLSHGKGKEFVFVCPCMIHGVTSFCSYGNGNTVIDSRCTYTHMQSKHILHINSSGGSSISQMTWAIFCSSNSGGIS